MTNNNSKMSAQMPELGSKITLISKADIRYEGRLFTVDPQECTIALANGKKADFCLRYCRRSTASKIAVHGCKNFPNEINPFLTRFMIFGRFFIAFISVDFGKRLIC